MIKSFLNKDLNIFKKTAFLTKDLNIVKNIHFLYGKDLNYYFRNNIWIITSKYITKPNNIELFKDILKIKKFLGKCI